MAISSTNITPAGATRLGRQAPAIVIATYKISGIKPWRRPLGDNLSDYRSSWRNRDPVVMLIEDDVSRINPNWHTLDDWISTFNRPCYVQVAQNLIAPAAHPAGIEQTRSFPAA